MTRPLTKEYAPSLESFHPTILASHTAKTAALDMFMSTHKARQKQNMDIQGRINSVMKAAKRSVEIWFILSSQMFPLSMTGLRQKQPPA